MPHTSQAGGRHTVTYLEGVEEGLSANQPSYQAQLDSSNTRQSAQGATSLRKTYPMQYEPALWRRMSTHT